MAGLGIPELFFIFMIVLVIFGVGRVSKIGLELGQAVSNFRKGVRDGDAAPTKQLDEANKQ